MQLLAGVDSHQLALRRTFCQLAPDGLQRGRARQGAQGDLHVLRGVQIQRLAHGLPWHQAVSGRSVPIFFGVQLRDLRHTIVDGRCRCLRLFLAGSIEEIRFGNVRPFGEQAALHGGVLVQRLEGALHRRDLCLHRALGAGVLGQQGSPFRISQTILRFCHFHTTNMKQPSQ